eukprot:GHVT01031940.1.p1 GENE.GHVT01031940.1~~GHVT01031940.1.p1  ORF type:complete len:134 (+),score=12.23 GHVT01031940.1:626-1027(+)
MPKVPNALMLNLEAIQTDSGYSAVQLIKRFLPTLPTFTPYEAHTKSSDGLSKPMEALHTSPFTTTAQNRNYHLPESQLREARRLIQKKQNKQVEQFVTNLKYHPKIRVMGENLQANLQPFAIQVIQKNPPLTT